MSRFLRADTARIEELQPEPLEIPSEIILQPGPAALTNGVDAIPAAIAAAVTELA